MVVDYYQEGDMGKKVIIFTNILLFVITFLMIDYIKKLDVDKEELLLNTKELSESIKKKDNEIERLNKKAGEFSLVSYRDDVIKKKYPAISKIIEVVYYKSEKYGFNPDLILSLIHTESSFRPKVVSSQGAYGLMQVNFSVWKDELQLDSSKIFDIEYNIEMGLKILKRYYDKSNGDIMRALHLYNNGYRYNNTKYNKKVISTIYY